MKPLSHHLAYAVMVLFFLYVCLFLVLECLWSQEAFDLIGLELRQLRRKFLFCLQAGVKP